MPERSLDDPALAAARRAVELVLKAHEPFPGAGRRPPLADGRRQCRDRAACSAGVAPHLLAPPVNVLRLSLHPEGVAPRIVNLAEWRAHIFHRLEAQIEASADPVLADLLAELRAYPGGTAPRRPTLMAASPCRCVLRAGEAELSFLSTTTMFGTPIDITLAELAIEAFLPADAAHGGDICWDRAEGKVGRAARPEKCARPAPESGTMWTPDIIHAPCQSVKSAEIRAFHGERKLTFSPAVKPSDSRASVRHSSCVHAANDYSCSR